MCPVRIQDRLPSLAEEIVGLKPDVIVAAAVNAAVPAHAATSEIRHGTVWGTKAKPSVTSWPTALLSLWPRARQDARPFADEAFLSSTCLANNSGSLATFAVIPCASPLLSSLAAERRPRSFSTHVCELLPPLIAHDKAGVQFLDSPGGQEVDSRWSGPTVRSCKSEAGKWVAK